jgi:hypothetical protein
VENVMDDRPRIEVHPITSTWLTELVACVRDATVPDGPLMHLGYRSRTGHVTDVWVYPSPCELYSGPHDGVKVWAGFDIKLTELLTKFDRIKGVVWRAPVQYNAPADGPGVHVTGVFRGRPVSLRLLSLPLADAEPSAMIDADTGRCWPKTSEVRASDP